MSSIHDGFDLIKKISLFRTSAEIDGVEDDGIRQELVEDDAQFIRNTLDRLITEARAIVAHHPFDYIDFSAPAIREHYFEHDKEAEIEGLSDQDLHDAGEWALDNGQLWDDIYAAWEYGIACVRSEKQKAIS